MIDRQLAFTGLVAGDHGSHRRCGIGSLLIPRVGLGQRDVREFFEGKAVFLTRLGVQLAFEDAGGSQRRDAHAVADEKDNVLGVAMFGVQALGIVNEALAVVVPVLDRLRTLDNRFGGRDRQGAKGKDGGERTGDHFALNIIGHY